MPVAADVKIRRSIEQILRTAFIIKIFLGQKKNYPNSPLPTTLNPEHKENLARFVVISAEKKSQVSAISCNLHWSAC